MACSTFKNIRYALLCLLSLAGNNALASHIIGGEITYKLISGTADSYQVILTIYEDCLNGQPEAIAQDSPAWIDIFDGTGKWIVADTGDDGCCGVQFTSVVSLPSFASNPCGFVAPPNCILQKTFIKDYKLPANATGYTVAYQRCCVNSGIVNIATPGNDGITIAGSIPAAPVTNNSAVFKNAPQQMFCINNPIFYDNSATDADGDSLSYTLSAALLGASQNNIKPPPGPPPYDSIPYISPYSSQNPMDASPTLQIDPVTGLITGTPNKPGRYVVAISCHEWRNGIMINTVSREYQFVTINCTENAYTALAWTDTSIMAGDSLQFNAYDGTAYTWTPATYLSDPNIANPVGYFPVPGVFTYMMHADNNLGCNGDATVKVYVLDHAEFNVPNAFTPNGDNKNDVLTPIPMKNCTLKEFKIFNRKGNLVFSTNTQGDGWDGTYHGKPQDTDTFYWELLYLDNNSVSRKMKGSTILIR